jgi:hypothetical protein
MAKPIPQFLHIVKELKKLDLAWIHLVESRLSGSAADGVYQDVNRENDPLVAEWGNTGAVLLAGGYTTEKAKRVLNEVHTGGEDIRGTAFVRWPCADELFRQYWDRIRPLVLEQSGLAIQDPEGLGVE